MAERLTPVVVCVLAFAACHEAVAATVALAATGQVTCYDQFGRAGPCTDTGQDGEVRAGAEWPSPRFDDSGNGTMRDNLTGLDWARDGNPVAPAACSSDTEMTWQEALDYVACINANAYLGIRTWRLPNALELYSLVNAGQADSATWLNVQGFQNVQSTLPYWTSTTASGATVRARVVDLSTSREDERLKTSSGTVLPVHRGPNDTADAQFPANLPKTGQSACHDETGALIACAGSGQDGELRWGVTRPSPRFQERGDDTVLDHLTDLIWTIDAHAPGPAACSTGVLMDWQAALDYVACLNANQYLGFIDWRLPNANELKSLADHSQSGPFLAPGHPFVNVQASGYWSSTTSAASPDRAFLLSWLSGALTDFTKAGIGNWAVWPVRGDTSVLPADDVNDCVIATAAYGSPLHEDLDVLRRFRDDRLMTSRIGRELVRQYYVHAPPLADYVADRAWLKRALRLALAPIVYALKNPLSSLALLILGATLAATLIWRGGHKRSGPGAANPRAGK